VSHVSHAATFGPTDELPRILDDLACPCCRRRYTGEAHTRITDNKLRMFCDGCGAFATIELTDEQVGAIRRVSATMPAIGGSEEGR
jgi:hypothetical protein